MTAFAIIKIIAVPVLIYFAVLLAKKFGSFFSALFIGLPLVSGPVSLFITLEQGTEFGEIMAYHTMPGVCACVWYNVMYACLSRKFSWQLTLLFSLTFYVIFAALLCLIPLPLPLWIVIALLAPIIGLKCIPAVSGKSYTAKKRKNLLWEKMVLGVLAMIIETACAPLIGAQWTGIIIFFPVLSGIVMLFAQIETGAEAVPVISRGNLVGLFGAISFAVIVAVFVTVLPIAATYLIALAAAFLNSFILSLFITKKNILPIPLNKK